MFRRWFTASAAAVVGLVAFTSLTQAAPQELMGVDANGKTFSSGWTWDVSSAQAGQVNLVFIRSSGNDFFIEKDAVMTSATSPIVIDFAPISGKTQSTLVINDEAVRNQTGVDWTGFHMALSSGNGSGGTSSFSFATSNGASGIGDFRIDPFTTATFTSASDLVLGGGTVASGTTWFPGAQSTSGLALVAQGGSGVGFQLTEQAVTGPGPGPVPIPLPASVWTGLSGLIGLGVLGLAKNAKKHLA